MRYQSIAYYNQRWSVKVKTANEKWFRSERWKMASACISLRTKEKPESFYWLPLALASDLRLFLRPEANAVKGADLIFLGHLSPLTPKPLLVCRFNFHWSYNSVEIYQIPKTQQNRSLQVKAHYLWVCPEDQRFMRKAIGHLLGLWEACCQHREPDPGGREAGPKSSSPQVAI
jgi:hypothetical protein